MNNIAQRWRRSIAQQQRRSKQSDAQDPMVARRTQHGSGVANPPQSPTSQARPSRGSQAELESLCPARDRNRHNECETCTQERMASMGDTARQRRHPVHPQGPENLVKPCGSVSTENVLRLLEYQEYRCALTGRGLTPETASLDHVLPIRCNGEHVIENTQVLHRDVNRAKGSLTNEEFIRMCCEVVDHMTHRRGSRGAK